MVVLPFDRRVHVAGEAIAGDRGTYGLRATPRIELGVPVDLITLHGELVAGHGGTVTLWHGGGSERRDLCR